MPWVDDGAAQFCKPRCGQVCVCTEMLSFAGAHAAESYMANYLVVVFANPAPKIRGGAEPD